MSSSISVDILTKFTTFGDLLRFLRRRAGLTQQELSMAVGYSDAQISRLEQNQRMPDIPTIEARFVPVLALENEPKVIARLLELAANVRREEAPGLGLCPYKGLEYFDERDAELFVGREALTARLIERILSRASAGDKTYRFLAVVGASGCGKSSIVRAGLVPGIRRNPLSAHWPIHVLTPSTHPLESLAISLTPHTGSVLTTAALIDDLRRDPRSLDIFLKRGLNAARASQALLVVDQFEELFTQCHSETERSTFIDNLIVAASAEDGKAVVVISLRADFYAYCAKYPLLREALSSQQEFIGSMTDDELRRAIEEPARRNRWEFEPGLVELLLRDVGHEPGALPLLSHALMETWQRRRGRLMTLSGYTSSGGVHSAIAESAEAVYVDQLSRQQRIIARRIFIRLTELGDETSTGDTRRRATIGELISRPEDADSTYDVLTALADARLITMSDDSSEVAHEALIREWPRLRGWLEDNRADLRLHQNLSQSAQEWQGSDLDPDLLYRGLRLAQACDWAKSHDDEMNELEREFLAAAIDYNHCETAEREEERQRSLEAEKKLAEAERQCAEEQARKVGQLLKRVIYLGAAFAILLGMIFAVLFF